MDTERRNDMLCLLFLALVAAFGAQGQPSSSSTAKVSSNITSRTANVVDSQLDGFIPNPSVRRGHRWTGDEPWIEDGQNVGESGARFCIRRRGQFPHPLYCDRFYNCWDGAVYVQHCPEGLMFQDDLTRPYCDFPANVRCGARGREVPRSNRMCPRSSGIFSHPNDCRLFVSCVGGKSFVQTCPRTLLFNTKLKVCDHAYNVQCGVRRPNLAPEVDPDEWFQGENQWWPDSAGNGPWSGDAAGGVWPAQPGTVVRPVETGIGSWPGLGAGPQPFPVYGRSNKLGPEPRDNKNE